MSQHDQVPKPTVKRLSLYLRELEQRSASQQDRISSKQLGSALGLTDAQVRKDLAYFGQFGHPGVGYQTQPLIEELRQILGTHKTWHTALIGAGNLGRALMSYGGWTNRGFDIVAVFDDNPELVGVKLENHKVRPMKDLAKLIKHREIHLAILAVPADAAQEIADQLIDAGIRGILNFAPKRLDVHDAISISSVDLAVQLEQLAFQVSLGLTGSLDDEELEGG